jgi:hypothetical protein
MRAEVIRDKSDRVREVWTFRIDTPIGAALPPRANLSTYAVQERATKRHKWRTVRAWGQAGGYTRRHSEASYPLPADVVIEATAQLTHQVRLAMGTMVSAYRTLLADHRLERMMLRDERASADRPFGDVWLDALEAEAKRRGWK